MMLELKSVTTTDFLSDVSCRVATGAFAAFVTTRESINEVLVRLLLGLDTPDYGTIIIMDREVTALARNELVSLRKRVGVVHPGGGLISNLRVWDNVVLPLSYHTELAEEEIEELATAAVRRVGYEGSLSELPGNLTVAGRRLLGFARVLLMRPQLVIYHATFEGLQEDERLRLIRVAEEFHREEPGRTSLLITANPATLDGLPIDSVFRFSAAPNSTPDPDSGQ